MDILREQGVSSSSSGGSYEVFLSFRYADVGKTFADHLHSALCKGFRIFRYDENMERGKNFKSELQKVIKESRMSIVVFSKGYASSSWCLDELEIILQHKTPSGDHHVLPIFYDVDPSHVRTQMGSFKEAFESYEEGEGENGWKSRVGGWKAALREAADIAGMHLQNDANGHEAKFIQKIVEEVQEKLDFKVLEMPRYSIGIDSRAKSILSWLNDGSRDVGMLAICGIGGLGKTTIAKFVYNNHIRSRFEGSSFLANIASKAKQEDLTIFQTQLLSDMKVRGEKVNNVDEGIVKIQNALKCRSVLLVLDDVAEPRHLYAMVGNCDWLHTGSKIIITTKDKRVFRAHKKFCVPYELQILNPDESLELFSRYAFRQNKPDECFKEILEKLANHCRGLPLAIQIVGSSLFGECLSIWEDQLKKLVAIPNDEIYEKLKISYDLLDLHDKELFLHVACFFLGYDKDYVVTILEECELCPKVGFNNLINKCLLTIGSEFCGEKLEMYQLVQEIGREIVRQESPKDLGNRSRIWNSKDSLRILREKSATAKIEGLVLDIQKSESGNLDDSRKRKFQEAFNKSFLDNLGNWFTSTTSGKSCEMAFETETFAVMRNLRFLVINYLQLNGSYKNFPKGLRWLCWHGSLLQSIPSDFRLERLVILEMPYSSVRNVWTGAKELNNLKILNLSNSCNLIKTPDFSLVSNLEKLILENCTSLEEIHESIVLLKKLVFLNLNNCTKLSKFPRSNNWLKSLTVAISGCPNLEKLLKWLQKGCETIVYKMCRRQDSSISPWSSQPNRRFRIPLIIDLFSYLVDLRLIACNLQDDAFPADGSKLFSLKRLDLSNNPIHSFPDCFTGIAGLESLTLSSCTKLRSITNLPVKSLFFLIMDDCTSLEKVTSLSLPPDDIRIHRGGCENLVELLNYFKIEPIENVDKGIVDNLGISNWESMGITNTRIYHYGARKSLQRIRLQALRTIRGVGSSHQLCDSDDMAFSTFTTCFPGSEVPTWYNFKTKGAWYNVEADTLLTYLKVPFYGDDITVQGLNMCVVLIYKHDRDLHDKFCYQTSVCNESNGMRWDMGTKSPPVAAKISQDTVNFSYWKFNHDELKSGDILSIDICAPETSKVKEVMGNEAAIRLRQFFSATEAVNIPLKVARRGKRGLRPLEDVRQWHWMRMMSECPIDWYLGPIEDVDPCSDYLEMNFKIFATYLSESEVPTWCNFRSKGSSIKLTVPSYPDNTKILGLNVCCVYTLLHHSQGSCYDNGEENMTSVNNNSTGWIGNNMIKWVIGDTKITGDIMELSYWKSTNENSYAKCNDDEIRSGDKLVIQVFANNEYFKVKETGVRIVSKKHGEGDNEGKQVCTVGKPCARIYIHVPDNFKFKLNSHVYWHERDGVGYYGAAYGGVLRDGEGKWIVGYYEHHPPGFSPDSGAHCWAIYKALKIIAEKGWSNVFIQTDDWYAVRDIHGTTTSASESKIISKIFSLCSRCNCTLSYIIPERNKLAQLIAILAKSSYEGLVILESPPDDPEINGILHADVKRKFT